MQHVPSTTHVPLHPAFGEMAEREGLVPLAAADAAVANALLERLAHRLGPTLLCQAFALTTGWCRELGIVSFVAFSGRGACESLHATIVNGTAYALDAAHVPARATQGLEAVADYLCDEARRRVPGARRRGRGRAMSL